MDVNFWLKLSIAIVMGIMIIRMWPAANHWLKHGPKGSNKEWLNLALILAGVVGFVILLILMVRK